MEDPFMSCIACKFHTLPGSDQTPDHVLWDEVHVNSNGDEETVGEHGCTMPICCAPDVWLGLQEKGVV